MERRKPAACRNARARERPTGPPPTIAMSVVFITHRFLCLAWACAQLQNDCADASSEPVSSFISAVFAYLLFRALKKLCAETG
jgi:hypothetical protein